MIDKDRLKFLIEAHFEECLIEDAYEINTINSTALLTSTRFDIAFKLLFLEMKNKNVSFAKEFYTDHIRAFTLGEFTEPGNQEKNSIEVFFSVFDEIFEKSKANGFDSSISLIPLSSNNSIANGSHRVASAIYLDKNVDCVYIGVANHIYNYNFFYNRNIPSSTLDVVATKFVEYADHIHIAFIWPTAKGHGKEIDKIIPNIVYKKDIKLNPNGAHNLLSQIYNGEEWLGCIDDDFKGSKGKLVECFKNFEAIKIIAFQAEDLEKALAVKDRVRDLFNVGKHSIHVTDTKEEAINIARTVFSDNSIHFLNHAKPNKYISTHAKINRFKEFLKANNILKEDVLLDSSMVLSAYGLREAIDTDFFCFDNENIKVAFDDIGVHDEELNSYNKSKHELIYDPCNYFYFEDLKFISFDNIYEMKKNGEGKKDKNDCVMMNALMEGDDFRKYLNQFKQKVYYKKIQMIHKLVKIIKRVGLYNFTRNIYKLLKS